MSSSLSRRALVEAVAERLDVAIFLDEPSVEPVECWLLDDGEREALVIELAGALGVPNGGAEALERGSLSIDPTEPVECGVCGFAPADHPVEVDGLRCGAFAR